MLSDEDEDVGDPDFDLDALPGDGPSVDESINVSSASFEVFKALEGDIRPLPRDGDYGIHQPRVHVRRLHRRELGVGRQGGGKGFLINEPSIYEDECFAPYYVWPPIINVRLIWIHVGEYMDDVFHLYDGCDRHGPICVWLWNACTYGLPRSPPCASKFMHA